MKITKLGHCCLLVEENGVNILTDPGMFTVEQQEELTGLHILLITHEHADHLHADSVRKILANNPGIKIVCNSAVAKILSGLGIDPEIVGDDQSANISNITIEGFGKDHAEIYEDYGLVENTGYLVNGKLFFPGDAFTNPGKHVEILALPVAGPWMLIRTAINYAKELKPKTCFPVHDGILASFANQGIVHPLAKKFIEEAGIGFAALDKGQSSEF